MAKRQRRTVPIVRLHRGQPPPDPQKLAEGAARREAQARESRIRRLEQKLSGLRQELVLAVRRIVPKCRGCGGEDIQIRTSHHLIHPGNDTCGPAGRGPTFATHLDLLYCEVCGQTYYTSKVAQLAKTLEQIKKVQDELLAAKPPLSRGSNVGDLLDVVGGAGSKTT